MTKRITAKEAGSIFILVSFISVLIFLMIEVAWAQVMKDTVIQLYTDSTFLVILLIIGGFLLSSLVSFFASFISADMVERKYALIASLLALVINIVLWIIISYITIIINAPGLVEGLSAMEKIGTIPRVIAYFSVYQLSNVTILWLLACITHAAIFSVVLYVIKARKSKAKYGYARKW